MNYTFFIAISLLLYLSGKMWHAAKVTEQKHSKEVDLCLAATNNAVDISRSYWITKEVGRMWKGCLDIVYLHCNGFFLVIWSHAVFSPVPPNLTQCKDWR